MRLLIVEDSAPLAEAVARHLTAQGHAVDVLGEENIVEVPVAMGSEDFSYFGEKVPAAYVFLGIADEEKGTNNQHHNPKFNVNDKVLPRGAALLAAFAMRMNRESRPLK